MVYHGCQLCDSSKVFPLSEKGATVEMFDLIGTAKVFPLTP
jgi:hypothetical protein